MVLFPFQYHHKDTDDVPVPDVIKADLLGYDGGVVLKSFKKPKKSNNYHCTLSMGMIAAMSQK